MAKQPHDPNKPSRPGKKVTQAQPPLEPDELLTDEELQRLEQAEAEMPSNRPGSLLNPPPSNRPDQSDGAIDLGLLAPVQDSGEPSGISVVQWASLMDAKSGQESSGDANAKFDSPSDADLRGRGAGRQDAAEVEVDLDALEAAGERSESSAEAIGNEPVLNLDALATPQPRGKGEEEETGEGGIDLADLVEDASPPALADAGDEEEMIDLHSVETGENASSALDLSSGREDDLKAADSAVVVQVGQGDLEEEVIVEETAPSGVGEAGVLEVDLDEVVEEMGEIPSGESGVIDVGEDMVIVDESAVSGVIEVGEDLVIVEEASAGGSGPLEVSEMEVIEEDAEPAEVDLEVEQTMADDEGSSVALGSEPRSYDASPSGRDLIAEAVESGVNLDMDDLDQTAREVPVKKPGKKPSPEGSAVDLTVGKKPESPLSATGVTAEAEELDLEFLQKLGETSGLDQSSIAGPAGDLPLESITEEESDAIDLARATPEKPGDSASSGIHSEEEVDLEALMAAQERPGSEGSRGGYGPTSTPSGSLIDLDAEAVDLGSGESSSGALHRAALEEEDEIDRVEKAGSGRRLRIDDLESEEDLEGEEAEAEEMAVPEEDEAGEFEESLSPKAVSPARVWIGAGAGTLIGAGGCFLLAYFGLLPGLGPKETSSPRNPIAPVVQGQQRPATPSMTAADFMKAGDLAKAKEAGIEKGDDPGLRGQYRWENYLVGQGRTNQPLNLNDPGVKQAIEDLQKAATADSLFTVGQIYEMTNQRQEALKTYQLGTAKFKNDKRFQAGLLRLEVTRDAGQANQGARRPVEDQDRARAALLALLLVGLQQPADNQPAAANEPEEAGFPFWEAMKFARDQNYSKAIEKLKEAQKLHEQRRKLLPRRPQNPTTDPNEQIFLEACNELVNYWQIVEQLRNKDYLKNLAGRNAPNQAVAALFKEVDEGKKAQVTLKQDNDKLQAELKSEAQKITDLNKKVADTTKELEGVKLAQTNLGQMLVTDKIIQKPEELGAGIDTLLANRKTDAKKIMDLDQKLQATQKEVAAQDDMLKMVQKELHDAKYLDKETDRAKLLQSIKQALDIAKMNDPAGEVRGLRKQKDDLQAQLTQEKNASKKTLEEEKARLTQEREKAVTALTEMKDKVIADLRQTKDKEIATLKTESEKKTAALEKQLQQRRPPAEMLAIWLPVLEGADREQSQRAAADAGAVLNDPMAAPPVKSQARVIQGLAFRNVDQFPEAKMALAEALQALPEDAQAWRAAAQAGLKEVSDPLAYFTNRAEEFRNRGDLPQARATLDRGVKVLGAGQPQLLAERGLLSLELAQVHAQDGKIPENDPNLSQALKDAKDALEQTKDKADQKAARALAYYTLGRVYEELNEPADALENYRAAVKEHPAADAASSRYRLALARVLALPRQGRPPLPAAPKEEEKKKDDAKISLLPTLDQIQAAFLVLLTTSVQPPEPFQPGKTEALKLADEIIRQHEMDPKSVPFDVLAGAYQIRGQWTRALQTYAEGLKPNLRPDYYEGLMNILRSHPQIRRPESLSPPNPFEAESQYGRGLRFYFGRDYAQAEKHFKAATEYDNQDARYFYFLGLARLMQGNTEAAEDFEQGARLEKQNKPGSPAVSSALERVQGPARRVLNEVRVGIR